MRFRSLIICLSMLLMFCIINGQEMSAGNQPIAVDIAAIESQISNESDRDPATYTFSVNPVTLMMSYYDYMIGGYNSLPLNVNPNQYGGYFLTYHGKSTPTGTRRTYYDYIINSGIVQSHGAISTDNYAEGYPQIAIDPVSGKPLYAWHSNVDADAQYEIRFAYDAFISGLAGMISTPVTILNNPSTMPAPYNTTNNEYIWPTIKIGPSPVNGMRRVYVLSRNSITHITGSTDPSENVRINYADFNANMLEAEAPLTWNYTSIPILDAWNHANDNTSRRPNNAFTVGNDGRIYFVGYHSASTVSPSGHIVEPDLDAFVCDNYGQGTWTRITASSQYPSWNPPTNFGAGPGYYKLNDGTTSIPSNSLYWKIFNSAHINAEIDNTNGDIHLPGLWAQGFTETVGGVLKSFYHPSMQVMRDLVYDTNLQTFSIREIYPIAGTSTDNVLYLPWDQDGNGTVDSYYDTGDPVSASIWPFPYWDSTASTDAMMFHYSNTKITAVNAEGMMAAVWQDSNRAKLYNTNPAVYPELAPFATAPEIWIAVSPDFGITWSDPIKLNKVETAQLAGMKPMWVYPADQVKYVGLSNEGKKIGKLAIMFYDDITWGSYQQVPPLGANDGGYVKFMELNITFPLSSSSGTITQNIPLESGWNMISLNVHPANMDISAIFSELSANLITVKSTDGVYIPNNPFNTLTQLQDGKGYYVKVAAGCSLSVQGTPINISTPISLQQGWNLVAYTPQTSQPVVSALSTVSDNLIQAKGLDGVYIPDNPFNTLTSLNPGKCYWIKLNAADQLIYPQPAKGTYTSESNPIASPWGMPFLKTDSHVILTRVNGNADENDVLAAFVGEELRGISVLNKINGVIGALLQVFTESAGEEISFKLYKPGFRIVQSLSKAIASAPGTTFGNYDNNEFFELNTSSGNDIPVIKTNLAHAYPNPFNPSTTISFSIGKDQTAVSLDIYNVRGQKVKTLVASQLAKGEYNAVWDGRDDNMTNAASGVYFCRFRADNIQKSIKLIMVK